MLFASIERQRFKVSESGSITEQAQIATVVIQEHSCECLVASVVGELTNQCFTLGPQSEQRGIYQTPQPDEDGLYYAACLTGDGNVVVDVYNAMKVALAE